MNCSSDPQNIVIVGCSGHAKVAIDTIEKESNYRIVGLINSSKDLVGSVLGYPILGCDEDLPRLVKDLDIYGCFIAIGDNWKRSLMFEKLSSIVPKLVFISAIHPLAYIAKGVEIGRGSILMAGALVNSASKVGDFCILNSNSSLDHDGIMEKFSALQPGAITGGNVQIGAFSVICLGANLIQGIKIGQNSIVGAGSLVLHDIPENSVAYGVPAKVVRKRERTDNYL